MANNSHVGLQAVHTHRILRILWCFGYLALVARVAILKKMWNFFTAVLTKNES